jgi:predicted nucleotidyltransferase
MATKFKEIYQLLEEAGIKFILIGGGAANVHGSARLTLDVDVVYSRELENMQKLVTCLAPLHPYLRGAPPGLPFRFDLGTLRNGLNFTLSTDFGDLDLLGEVAGGGTYEALLPHTKSVIALGVSLRCLDVDKLIALKRAAGRTKDLEMIAELEIIRQEQGDR